MYFSFINIVKERYPLKRVDDSVLVQKNIPIRGGHITWFLQNEKPSSACVHTDVGNTFFVAPNGRRKNIFLRMLYNAVSFFYNFKLFQLNGPFDFVQVKDLYLSALIGMLYARLKNIKFVFWISFPFPEAQIYKSVTGSARYPLLYKIRGSFYRFLQYKFIMRFADHIFVQSDKMKEDIHEWGIPEGKMTVVPMGITLDDFPRLDELLAVEPEVNTVAYLGTMNQVRHLEFLLEAFVVTLKSIPSAKLYMVGGGDEAEDLAFLKAEAHRLGIDDAVVFTGFLPRDQALSIIKRVSVCVSPFYPTFIFNSTSPTKLVEYLALAKPCVVNDHPEQRLIIEECGAGLCVPWEPEAFGAAMVELLSDSAKAKEMGRKGRTYVEEKRSYELLSDELAESYRSIING